LCGVEGKRGHGHEERHAHDQPRQHQDHQQLPTVEEVGKSGELLYWRGRQLTWWGEGGRGRGPDGTSPTATACPTQRTT
jgi:hypothetical protein